MASIESLKAAAQNAIAAGDFRQGEHLTRQALRQAPNDPDLWSSHADALDELDRIAEAAAAFQHAVVLDPSNAARLQNYAMNRLKLGFLAEGFRIYEARIPLLEEAGGLLSGFARHPRWDGCTRQRVIVCGEQGLGDQIMFARFLPRVAAIAGAVTVAVRPALIALFARHFAVLQPSVAGSAIAEMPAFDSWIPMGSLPKAVGCRVADDLRSPAYLTADPARVARWSGAIDRTRFAVGLAWHGNPNFARNERRSLAVSLLEPLRAIEGARFYGLQVPSESGVPAWLDDLAPRIGDFEDTAAILDQIDLLVTSDTAIAHLAGAMGRPVWLMLSRVCDWRWGLEGVETPWYGSMRLFRQPALGDWPAVIEQIAASLRDLTQRR